jgi:hypothetical protein
MYLRRILMMMSMVRLIASLDRPFGEATAATSCIIVEI